MRIGQNDNLMAINIGQGCSRCIITEYIKMIWNENNNDTYHFRAIRQVYFNENDILVTRHDMLAMTFVNFEITLKWN